MDGERSQEGGEPALKEGWPMAWLGVIGGLLDGVFKLVDKGIQNKDEATRIKAGLQMALMNNDAAEVAQVLKSSTEVIVAEAKGESYLQRNWRPIIMLLMGVIIANNYVIAPYTEAMFGITVMLPIPPDMWDLLKLGIGGYIVGRSGEKMVKAYVETKKGGE